MHKNRILMVTTNFWPEPAGISLYATDTAKSLADRGIDVTVLTSLPHYPWWKIPQEFSHMTEGESEYGDVKILRAKHFIPPKFSVIQRIRFETSLWWNLRKVYNRTDIGNFDAVIAFIPTVAAGLIAKKVAKRLRRPLGIIVQDLSGLSTRQSGLKGGALISGAAKAVENLVISAAAQIVVISPGMKRILEKNIVRESNVSLILNYTAGNIEKLNKVESRKLFGWHEKDFIVLHAGNMGSKQDLGNVVTAADLLDTESRIKIYLVGHGNQESKLKLLCHRKPNITVMPAVSESDYSALLSAADLLLVNERSTQIDMSLPSKLTSYLYSKRPVIAAVPRGGATWAFLDGIAELVEAGDPNTLARAIGELHLNHSKLDEMAKRGEEYAVTNLSREEGRKKYFEWIDSLIASE